MSLKDELIKRLTLKQLKELAQENRVILRRGDWKLGDKTVTTKKDIIALLMNSKKITKKKIEDKLFGPKTARNKLEIARSKRRYFTNVGVEYKKK